MYDVVVSKVEHLTADAAADEQLALAPWFRGSDMWRCYQVSFGGPRGHGGHL